MTGIVVPFAHPLSSTRALTLLLANCDVVLIVVIVVVVVAAAAAVVVVAAAKSARVALRPVPGAVATAAAARGDAAADVGNMTVLLLILLPLPL